MRKGVLASLLVLSTVAVAACDESKPTFDVYGQLTGTREPTSVESRCVFPDETVTEGDMVTVRGRMENDGGGQAMPIYAASTVAPQRGQVR